MLTDVNSKVATIAGMVMTAILCYELISMIMEKNNMHEIDTWMFYRWTIKAVIAVYFVTNTFDIVMGIFDVAQHMVNASAGAINTNASIDIDSSVASMVSSLSGMSVAELTTIALETAVVKMTMTVITILIMVILYGRMIEIYLTTSVAAIPLATMANREWSQVGTNYIRGIAALGLQGFFIMIAVGIYAVLINSITISSNIHLSVLSIMSYTVILCFALVKTFETSKKQYIDSMRL